MWEIRNLFILLGNPFIYYLKDRKSNGLETERVETVLRADNVVTSSSPEILLEKMLAYLALRTGYHPLSPAPSFALFHGKNSDREKSFCLIGISCYPLMTRLIILDI